MLYILISLNSVFCQCHLTVNSRETRVPPSFTERLSSCRVKAGQQLVLQVKAEGQPIPGLAWQKVGRQETRQRSLLYITIMILIYILTVFSIAEYIKDCSTYISLTIYSFPICKKSHINQTKSF